MRSRELKKYNFSMVYITALQDPKLSLKAKGLYSLIQSLITREYGVYKWQIQKYCCEGKKAFENAWNELKANGYLKIYRYRDENNRFHYEFDLLDIPNTSTDSVINVKSQ